MANEQLPQFIQPFLWSYDLSKLDKQAHKDIIIKNILDFGDVQSTDWLKQQYTKEDITSTIERSTASSWSKKSLNFWSFIYDTTPKKEIRL